MSDADLAFHYVCTLGEAREIVARQERFWVSNCGCREERGQCDRSRMDLCLMFRDDFPSGGTGLHEATRGEVEAILQETESKHLVSRPFRNEQDRSLIDGICFCCDDCCGYFLHPDENICDRGRFIEETDLDACTGCGDCAAVCYFGVRMMDEGGLLIQRENCYGCGLCADVCPAVCVSMAERKGIRE